MHLRGITSLAAVVACVLSAVCGSTVGCGNRIGDLNGDLKADVRDVQMLVGMLTSHCARTPLADLNGDGRVDVIDFQRLLAETSRQADLPAVRPRLGAAPAVMPPPDRFKQSPPDSISPVVLSSTPARPARTQRSLGYVNREGAPPPRLPYPWIPASHAPPSLA